MSVFPACIWCQEKTPGPSNSRGLRCWSWSLHWESHAHTGKLEEEAKTAGSQHETLSPLWVVSVPTWSHSRAIGENLPSSIYCPQFRSGWLQCYYSSFIFGFKTTIHTCENVPTSQGWEGEAWEVWPGMGSSRGWNMGLLRNRGDERCLKIHFVSLPGACPKREIKENSKGETGMEAAW